MNRIHRYTNTALLLASGLLAVSIAVMILFVPETFYASYGIDIGSNVSLANEIKAPMGLLLGAGLFMLVGIFRSDLTAPALAVGTLVYLSFGLSRVTSIAIDGIPHSGLISAAGIELIIGALCLAGMLRPGLSRP